MKTYKNLFNKLCSYKNLLQAFNEAKKGKTTLPYVIKFNKNLKENLLELKKELEEGSYRPEKLTTFIIRDPKVRTISKSIFRDRIIHHAIVQIIEPIFEPIFIYDSYANRIGKGTVKALDRYNLFLRKVTKNGSSLHAGGGDVKNPDFIKGYVLKADIKKYFENVEQEILMGIIEKRIKDKKLISLIRLITNNFDSKIKGKGMPLGNLTSQFFANIYLNELDQFVKNNLKIKYYIRYVDDFIILHRSKEVLKFYKEKINKFLINNLKVELHPEKSDVIPLSCGTPLLGFRVFYHYRILRKKSIRRINARLKEWEELYVVGCIERETALDSLLGWMAYAVNGDTYKLRRKIMSKFNKMLPVK